MFSTAIIIYIITALASIAIALLLIGLARSSAPAKPPLPDSKKKKEIPLITAAGMERTIYEELSEYVESRQHCQQAAQLLTEVFGQELEKRAAEVKKEAGREYELILKEKEHQEEVTWKKYKKALGEKRDTEAVIRSIAEGLVVLDAQGKVIMMNPAAEKLLGVTKKDKIGKPLAENIREEQLISLVTGTDDPEKEDREIELVSPHDETRKILRASTAVVENENGNTVGLVSVLSDITKQKELDGLKQSFLASVSHELRTPLVAIEKSVSLLLSKTTGPITEAQQQFLDISERNLKRLSRLINDLLDLSKLEAGKLDIARASVSVGEVIDEAAASFETWAKTKNITIDKKIDKDLPQVSADRDRLMQVMVNLIGNALKFTPGGGSIFLAASSDSAKNVVQVSVADTGIGIDKDKLGKIFSKFYQVGERVSSDISGTGIGLSIAKEIVELHGGKIWAESEKDQGAKFIFTLPL